MKVRQIMTSPVISVHPDESVEIAARTLAHYNIGILPVCRRDGSICGLVTDRDLVTRCIASGRLPAATTVKQVMTGRVLAVQPEMEVHAAARYMGREQVRRLPVVENGKVCGMVSLGDLASAKESTMDAADALANIASNTTEGNPL